MSGKDPRAVTVRMYNVGFGDAFLVLVPRSKGRPLRILVDCGSIAAGPFSMDKVVKRLVQDVTDPDEVPRIDIVIATHRHRDHVSGFASEAWDGVEVREVWMPWTENPRDAEARRIRDSQASLAMHLAAAFAPKLGAEVSEPDIEGWTDEKHQMAMNALTNEKAMATLHAGFAGSPTRRFLPLRKDNDPIRIDGVTFHIAGPAFTEDVIRDMDPPAGHSYLAMLGDSPGEPMKPPLFDDYWRWTPDPDPLKPHEKKRIEETSEDLSDSALTSLEAAVNGTSLFIIMQIGDVNFVFPGDAQWGTWKAVLDNKEYAEMLASTRFYKIGHHGSHNATPVDFVKLLGKTKDMLSMASVRPISKWKDIPRPPLLDELAKHGHVARADDHNHGDAFTREEDGYYVETKVRL